MSLGSGEIFARVVAFVGTAYLARVLGPEGFGIVGFALAMVGYLSVSITAGVTTVGAREVARRPEHAPNLAASVIFFMIPLTLGALVVLGLIAWFLPKPETVKLVVFLSGLSFTSWLSCCSRGFPVMLYPTCRTWPPACDVERHNLIISHATEIDNRVARSQRGRLSIHRPATL